MFCTHLLLSHAHAVTVNKQNIAKDKQQSQTLILTFLACPTSPTFSDQGASAAVQKREESHVVVAEASLALQVQLHGQTDHQRTGTVQVGRVGQIQVVAVLLGVAWAQEGTRVPIDVQHCHRGRCSCNIMAAARNGEYSAKILYKQQASMSDLLRHSAFRVVKNSCYPMF